MKSHTMENAWQATEITKPGEGSCCLEGEGIRDPEVLLFLRASTHPGQCQSLELVLVLEAPTWVFSLLPTRNPEAEIVY